MLSNVLLLSDTGFKIYISFCYIFLVLTFIAALITVIIILFQKSNSDGIQGITASSETFFGKNKARSLDAKLEKLTTVTAVCFIDRKSTRLNSSH